MLIFIDSKRSSRLILLACIGIILVALVEAFEWPKSSLKISTPTKVSWKPRGFSSGITMGSRTASLGATASIAQNKGKIEPKKTSGADMTNKSPALPANESITVTMTAAAKPSPASTPKKAKNDAPTEEEERQMTREETLNSVLHHIDKIYGKGSILRLGDASSMNIETFSSGALTLDLALGGGYPKGRVIEIFGPESSGKTTLALHAVASLQKDGGKAAYIDAEHALDPVYAGKVGVKTSDLLVCQPDNGEMALDIVDQLIKSNAVDVIVVDSVAALVPKVELDGDMADQQMGLQARLMSKALRKITGSLSKSHCTVIFINQLRSKIGIMFGNPEVTAGGNSLKFYSSVRLDIRRREMLRDGAGIGVRVKVVKNKVAPPFRVVDFDVLFGSGIDQLGCLLDAAEGVGVVSRRGAYYQFGEVKLGQGRTQACASLKESSALLDQVVSAVKTATANRATDFAPNVFASIGGGGTGGGAAIGGLGSGSISDGAE